jgi:pimeloyl-ACP methyl ester carboxylesterase
MEGLERMGPIDRTQITAGGFTFDTRVAGPPGGRVVLLLHGFPESSRSWDAQLQALAEAGYRAVAFDQRGYSPGARPPNVDAYRMGELVGDCVAVTNSLGVDHVDLVGHDWGGAVAWQMAARHPERVRSLAVASTPHPAAFRAALADAEGEQAHRSWYMAWFQTPEEPERALLENDAAALRGLYTGLPQDAVEEYVHLFQQPGALTAALNWYRAAVPDLTTEIGPITMPTLYVWSTNDLALGREAAEATAAYVEGPYRFEVLEGVSHWIPEEVPETLNALLLEHLAGVAA